LWKRHEALGDQIIIFCDRISLISFLAEALERPMLSGGTSIEYRNFVFDMFRKGEFKTVLLSRIGDEAIDLPNANVGIEINFQQGSRRQMLQRLGRIMRPKESNVSSTYNAVFYTIITDDTLEINYFNKRRDYLMSLGFMYDLRFSEYG
jgi:DNA excision repair protein ERCC-3